MTQAGSPERDAAAMPEPWVVWSDYHQAWWGPDRIGYNTHLLAAGLYEEAEAKAIELLRSKTPDVPVPEKAMTLAQALAAEFSVNTRSGRTVLSELLAARSDRDRLDAEPDYAAAYKAFMETTASYFLPANVEQHGTIAQQILAAIAGMRARGQLHQSLCWNAEELELLAMFATSAAMSAARSPIREESNG